MDRRSVWRDQSHDLKIETAFGRSFLFVRVCSRLSPDHLKHNQAGIAPGPTYTARGLHPTVLPSWFHIVTARHPLVPRHSDYDWLIPSQLRMGRSSGATRIWMVRATPG
jgi:hypothetical protein